MPMTFIQLLELVAFVVVLMCGLDFLLGLVKKEWAPLSWEVEENERRESDSN